MKKLILVMVLGLLLIGSGLFAQTWPPSNLQYTVEDQVNVNLTWDAPQDPNDIILHYDDGTNNDGIGTGGAAEFDVAIRFEPDQIADYDGYYISQVDFFPREAGATYSVKVWSGADAGTLLVEQDCTPTIGEWNMVTLDSPVMIDATQELWIGYGINTDTGYPAGCDAGPAVAGYGDMIMFEGSWVSMADEYGLDYNWNIQGHVSEGKTGEIAKPLAVNNYKTVHKADLKQIFKTGSLNKPANANLNREFIGYNVYRDDAVIAADITETTYTDMDLADETYSYYITAHYDEGESEPTNTVDVTIEFQDYETILTQDFESGEEWPDGWTETTNSAVGWFNTQDGSSSFWDIPAGNGYYACSNDDMNDDDASMDYLISPALDLSSYSSAMLTFQSFFTGAYSQTAHVEVSTDGETFTSIYDLAAADVWTEVEVDLSDYAGTRDEIWVAFHSNDNGSWASGWAVDDVVITATGGGPQPLTIYDVQYTDNPGDDDTYPSPYLDSLVTLTGIVTATNGESQHFIQNYAGAWNGLYVYSDALDPMPAIGDEITLTGTIAEYYGLTELTDITEYTLNSSGNTLPEPTMIPTGDLMEEYEGVLVNVEDAECTEGTDDYGAWKVDDGSGEATIDDNFYAYEPTVGNNYDVTGPATYNFDLYRILPRDENDVTEGATEEYGTIEGNVYDSDSNPLDGAMVEAGDYSTMTDVSGYYSMEVLVGTYDVTASMDGYMAATETDVVVEADATVMVDFYLDEYNDELNPPRNLTAEVVNTNDIELNWLEPLTGGTINVLLVDDDGSAYLDFTDTQSYYETLFAGMDNVEYEIYDITEDAADGPDSDYMMNYQAVIWELGEQWSGGRTITANDETNIAAYIDNGGKVLISGHDWLYDAYSGQSSFSAGDFPYDYFGLESVQQDAFTVGESQGGPAEVEIVGAGYTNGQTVGLIDVFSAASAKDGVYLDYLTPHANAEVYSTYDGNAVGIQTANSIFTTAGYAGIVDGETTAVEYFLSSVMGVVGAKNRGLLSYNVYKDGNQIANVDTTQLTYLDEELEPGTYEYEVTAVYDDGESMPSDPAEATIYGVGSIAGTVIDGITEDPIEGATITAGDYSATSDGSGYYMISDVVTGTYDVVCNADPYSEQIVEDVVVNHEETTTVDFEMFDEAMPPTNVVATETEDETAVDVYWNSPGGAGGEEQWIHYDDGANNDGIGTGGAADFDVAIRFEPDQLEDFNYMYLTQVKFFPREAGCEYSVRVWTGADAANMVVDQLVDSPAIEEWNTVTLDNPVQVDASQELWIGYRCNTSAGYPAGCDAGPAVAGYGDMILFEGSWYSMADEYGLDYNWNIQGWLSNSAKDDIANTPIKMVSRKNLGEIQEGNLPIVHTINNTNKDKALENYAIYRLLEGDEDNEDNWVTLSESVEDTFYTDNGWEDLESGIYLYGVKAVYTGGNYSEASFSNPVPKEMTVDVTVNVTTNSGDDAQGTVVTLTNDDANPEHVYEMTAPTGGTLVFEDVWKGTYQLDAMLEGFDPYQETDIDLLEDTTLDVELVEQLLAVVGLTGEEVAGTDNILLTWFEPGTPLGFTQDFESGEEWPEGWTETTNSSVGWFLTQDGSSSFWDIPSGDGYYACANDDMNDDDGSVDYLITPEQDFSVINEMSISFDSYFTGAYSQTAHLEISTDGGASWDVVQDIAEADAWTTVTVDLSDYTGAGYESVWIGFHANDNGSWASGWAIDNVILGDGGVMDRELIGYKVYRDDNLLTDPPITETEYLDEEVAIGSHTWEVVAAYTTGESDPAIWEGTVDFTPNTIPNVTKLSGNYPNPFNPTTTINFTTKEAGNVNLTIYNIRGQKVKTLVNDNLDAASHSVVWNGKDDNGKAVSSGVYFYKMQAGKYTSTKKMILMK